MAGSPSVFDVVCSRKEFTMRFVISTLFLALAATAVELPDNLAHLAPAFESPDLLVEELRNFDKVQNEAANKLRSEAQLLAMQSQGMIREAEELESSSQKIPAAAKKVEAEDKKAEAEKLMADAQAKIDLLKEAYTLALQKYGDNAKLHNYYGELLYDAYGDEAGGLKAWHQAISFDSKLSNPYNNLGIHYFHVGSYEMGLENLDKAIELEKDNPDYHYNLAQMYGVYFPQIQEIRDWKPRKLYKDMMEHSKLAAKLAPSDYELLKDYAMNFFLAEKFDEKADWKDASAAWQTARAYAPNDGEKLATLLNEARLLLSAGKNAEAIRPLEEAQVLQPNSDVVTMLLEKARGKEQ